MLAVIWNSAGTVASIWTCDLSMWSGFPYNMAASEHSDAYTVSWGSKTDYQKRSRGNLSCLLWPGFGTHMPQLPLWSEAFPDGRCVKVTLNEEHVGGVYYYSCLPKIPPWSSLPQRGYFPHPIPWALTPDSAPLWALTLLSGFLLSSISS